MRIPANIISKDKYTIGNEYLYLDTYKEYQGFYYELSNKFFAGVDFNLEAFRKIEETLICFFQSRFITKMSKNL